MGEATDRYPVDDVERWIEEGGLEWIQDCAADRLREACAEMRRLYSRMECLREQVADLREESGTHCSNHQLAEEEIWKLRMFLKKICHRGDLKCECLWFEGVRIRCIPCAAKDHLDGS